MTPSNLVSRNTVCVHNDLFDVPLVQPVQPLVDEVGTKVALVFEVFALLALGFNWTVKNS